MALSKQYEAQAKKTEKFWKDAGERAAIGKEAQDKLGTYNEAAGGGTPIQKGEDFKLVDNPEEADAIREAEKNLPDEDKTNIRVKQPRNDDGTFGYNSQNRRGLRYKSRGTTIPDFLKEYVAMWHTQHKSEKDPIESQDADYMLTFELSYKKFIEGCKYYLEKEDMFRFLAGKGDIIHTKKAGGGAKTKEELERDKKVAKEKRNAILQQRAKDSPGGLSFQEGKGKNPKKIGPKFAKKIDPTDPEDKDPTNPEDTVPTVPTDSSDGYTDSSGKTYTKEQMESAATKFNEAFRDQLGVDLSTEDLIDAREAGLIDDEIWNALFEE